MWRLLLLLGTVAVSVLGALLWMRSSLLDADVAQAWGDITSVTAAFVEHRRQHGQWPDVRGRCERAIEALTTGRFLDVSFMLKRSYGRMETRCDLDSYILQVQFAGPSAAQRVAARMPPTQMQGETLIFRHAAR